jgi:hypothetical protein
MRFRSAVQFAAIFFGTVLAFNVLPLLGNKFLVGPHSSIDWSLFRLWTFVNLPGFLLTFPFLDLLAHTDDPVHTWNNWVIVMVSSFTWGVMLFIVLLLFVDDFHIRVKRILKRENRDEDRQG